VNDLMGITYNSYWGWQDGRKRNSREKNIDEPIIMLSHFWKLSDKSNLNTNVAFQTGTIGNSRIDYQLGNNPDPTYYKNLSSYYSNLGGFTQTQLDNIDNTFKANSQIDWNAMYIANQNSAFAGRSVYVLYEDRTDDNLLNANSILNSSLSDHIVLNAGINVRKLRSHNHQNLMDLMGGQYFLDIDPFYAGNASQSDLNNPDRRVGENQTYGYNYLLHALTFDGFTQFKFTYDKVDFYLAQNFSRTEYQREGLYRNGIYADNSFGKGKSITFENFGFKGGLTYKLNGRNYFDFNGLYQTKAPSLRNTFSNARLNNVITPDLQSERIASADASYILRTPKLKARLTGFYTKIQDASEISFFYGEGIGSDDGGDEDTFVSEIVTGIDKQNMGVEFGLEYSITSTIKATAAASYGQYIYSDNAKLKTNDDALAATGANSLTDFGTVYIKNYHQAGMPQTAASFGLEYRDPNFWWVGANVNYLANSYVDFANILRTDNFSIDSATGDNYAGATPETVRAILRQEKFDAFTLVNLTGGKSWRISKANRNTVGFFASVNNLFDLQYKTGGFEQSRKATFPDLQADQANGTPSFGTKYFYGYGRTFFVNFYINF
jgi:TonB dependent receptor